MNVKKRRAASPPKATAAQTELADALAGIGALTGASASLGRLFSLLWFSERPLSLEELAAGAGIAKSGASIALRSLTDGRLVKRLPARPDRRSYYVVAASPWDIVRHWLQLTLLPEIEALTAATDAGLDHARETGSRVLIDRFTAWQSFLTQSRTALERLAAHSEQQSALHGRTAQPRTSGR